MFACEVREGTLPGIEVGSDQEHFLLQMKRSADLRRNWECPSRADDLRDPLKRCYIWIRWEHTKISQVAVMPMPVMSFANPTASDWLKYSNVFGKSGQFSFWKVSVAIVASRYHTIVAANQRLTN